MSSDPNPPNDARLIANTLRGLGFDVIERIDATQKQMKRAVSAFGDKLEAGGKDTVGLFYYAGHGIQVGSNNYLIPVNAEINNEKDVDIESVSANTVLSSMEFAGNRLNIVIMDACRNNPYKRGFRSASRGLAKMEATTGTLIAYATAPGNVAADGSGRNSPYTQALSRAMNTPGITVERMFKQVRNNVVKETNNQQTPWESSSLIGEDFFFKGGPSTTGVAVSTQPNLPVDEKTLDLEFWQSVKGSTDADDYRAYLKQYPSGTFAELARVKAKKLTKTASVTPTESAAPTPSRNPPSEAAYWEAVKDGSMEDIQGYIKNYPNGQFKLVATMKLGKFKQEGEKKRSKETKVAKLAADILRKIKSNSWCHTARTSYLGKTMTHNWNFPAGKNYLDRKTVGPNDNTHSKNSGHWENGDSPVILPH